MCTLYVYVPRNWKRSRSNDQSSSNKLPLPKRLGHSLVVWLWDNRHTELPIKLVYPDCLSLNISFRISRIYLLQASQLHEGIQVNARAQQSGVVLSPSWLLWDPKEPVLLLASMWIGSFYKSLLAIMESSFSLAETLGPSSCGRMSCVIMVKFQGFSTVPLWTFVLWCLGLSVVGLRSWWIPGHICCRRPPKTPSLNMCILKLESNHGESKNSLTLQQLCHAAQAFNPSCTKRVDRAYFCLYSDSVIAWHHFLFLTHN